MDVENAKREKAFSWRRASVTALYLGGASTLVFSPTALPFLLGAGAFVGGLVLQRRLFGEFLFNGPFLLLGWIVGATVTGNSYHLNLAAGLGLILVPIALALLERLWQWANAGGSAGGA